MTLCCVLSVVNKEERMRKKDMKRAVKRMLPLQMNEGRSFTALLEITGRTVGVRFEPGTLRLKVNCGGGD